MAADPTQGKDGRGRMRGGGPRPLAATVGRVAKRALGRRGFAEGGLIADWRAVVGAELAASCWPERLTFPPGRKEGGVLRVLAAGGFALELQHLEPQVLERVNGHFGYRAVERIVIVQAPPGEAAAARPEESPAPVSPPDPADRAALEAVLLEVDDPDIRAALQRLGLAMLTERGA